MRLFLLLLLFLPVLLACSAAPYSSTVELSASADVRELTVLYSNDEHGWMEGREPGLGAAGLLGLWREKEGYLENGPFLLLSGGDHWTGPAISTWFEGEGMVEVMNAMGYDATAIGNHEFDFGLDNLEQRVRQANFPYLAANIQWRASETLPIELGILAYTTTVVNDLTIGIIGLSTINTPSTTNPINIADLVFLDYEPVLRETVKQLEALGPDLIFVVSHVCMAALRPLAVAVADLNISLMGGGHCNELVAEKVGETILLESNGHFRSYARAHFEYDLGRDSLINSSFSVEHNEAGSRDESVAQIVEKWRAATEVELSAVLGFSSREYPANDDRLQRAVIESWLQIDSTAELAINNRLALRAPLPRGEVTLADVVGLLPFENTIVAVELSGAEVLQVIAAGQRPFVAGLIRTENDWLLAKTGRIIDTGETYRVLINSFMYEGGAGYDAIAEYDSAGFDTEIHYRQPLVDWLLEQASTPGQPLALP
ncbi:MAG: bifunctional metallophosphatase/5'-nucleotidase [Gammaproteobacteria bacterium]|nr:bifunctional metallophosphatase/5'-nucleotidase [Gammaproteobacteria bacterium]